MSDKPRNVEMLPEMPRAAYWQVFTCASPSCRLAHLVPFDEQDRPLADVTFAPQNADRLWAELHGAIALKQGEK